MPQVTFPDELPGQVVDATELENRLIALRDAVNDSYRNQSDYDPGFLYSENDVAVYNNIKYVALDDTQGDLPSLSPEKWEVFGGGPSTAGVAAVATTVTVTSATVVPSASDTTKKVKLARSLMLIKVTTNRPAWVRLYADDASRVSDLTRGQTDDPAEGVNLVLEFRTDLSRLVLPTPNVLMTDGQASNLGYPSTITNLSSDYGAVVTTFDFYQEQGY